MMKKFIKLDHVGKILFEEFMEPYNLSQNALAKAVGVAPSRITDIVNGRRGITADTDLRLTRFFSLSEGYFLRLQEHLETTLVKQKINAELNKIIPINNITANQKRTGFLKGQIKVPANFDQERISI